MKNKRFYAASKSLLVTAGLLIGLGGAPLFAGDVPGLQFLLLRKDVRGMGMGNACSALSDKTGGLYCNPAGAALADYSFLSAGFNGYSGLGMNGDGSRSPMLGESSFLWKSRQSRNALGLSIATFGNGSNAYDVNGYQVFQETGEKDVAAALTYAHGIGERWAFGVQAQYASQKLNEGKVNNLPSYNYNAVLATLGLLYRTESDRLRLGAETYNIGLSKTAKASGGSLAAPSDKGKGALAYPSGMRLGAAYRLLEGKNLILAADYDLPSYSDASSINAGLEWGIGSRLALRGGISSGNKQIIPSFGIGIGLGRFLLDAAFNNSIGNLGLGSQVGLNLSWWFTPGPKKAPKAQKAAAIEPPKTLIQLHGQKLNLAVSRFVAESVEEPTSNFVADRLRTKFVNAGLFTIVDRSNMDKILAEQKFQQTGCTKQECAVQMGKILNVYKIVAGKVSKLHDVYFIHADVIDVQTGAIEVSGDEQADTFDDVPAVTDRLAKRLLASYEP